MRDIKDLDRLASYGAISKSSAVTEDDCFGVKLDIYNYEAPFYGKVELFFKRPSIYFACKIAHPFVERNLANFRTITLKEAQKQGEEAIDDFLRLIKTKLDVSLRKCLQDLNSKLSIDELSNENPGKGEVGK